MAFIMTTARIALCLLPAWAEGATQPATALPPYHALLLGIADGRGNLQVAVGKSLNRWGQVVGIYGNSTIGTHGVLWSPAQANDGSGNRATLFPIENSPGMPAGTADTYPTWVNDRGEVVGTAYTPGQGDPNQQQSWLWRPKPLNSTKGALHGTKGATTVFPTLSGQNGPSAAYSAGINNQGVIVAAVGGRPALWNPSTPNGAAGTWTIETTNGGTPNGINDAGQFVGATCSPAPWNGPYVHTGPLPMVTGDTLTSPEWIPPTGSTCVGYARAINALGDVVIGAESSAANVIDTYIYKNGVVTDLNPGNGGKGYAINKYDQIVGEIYTTSHRGVLYQGGSVIDLNGLNDYPGGLNLSTTTAINDAGQILADANGAPILLTPLALVTNPVLVTPAKPVISGTTYSIDVTVKNLGSTPITGPVSVALDGLTKGVTLTNGSGTTFYSGPGSVYANVRSSDLAAGATTAPFTLVFNNPGLKTIKFAGRVLGTTAPR